MNDTAPMPPVPPGPGRGQGYGPGGPVPGQGRPSGPPPGQGMPPQGPPPGQGYPSGPPPGQEYPPQGPPPGQDYGVPSHDPQQDRPPNPPSRRREPRGDGEGARKAALVIHSLADVAAAILGLWIVLYLLEANQGNPFVVFIRDLAQWLGWWAQDIFTMDNEGVRVFLNYGLPAVVYLLIGHGISAKVRHL